MYTDILGKKRMKLGLHIHTTESDGHKTPDEAAKIYKDAGYDAIALTDHWKVCEPTERSGLRIISGCEYNVGVDTAKGVFHIVALGTEKETGIEKSDSAQTIIDKIRAAGGLPILAHPAWSLNSVEQVKSLHGFGGTEIFNTVSGMFASNRPYSGEIVDLMANAGIIMPLLAVDDTHYYEGDETVGFIMLDVSDGKCDTPSILKKIEAGQFYATQGPEIHLEKTKEGIVCRCSPACEISFFSQSSWNVTRMARGENLTSATFVPYDFERWIRCEVTDANGKKAWSNIMVI